MRNCQVSYHNDESIITRIETISMDMTKSVKQYATTDHNDESIITRIETMRFPEPTRQCMLLDHNDESIITRIETLQWVI